MCIITTKCTKVCESIIQLCAFVGFDVIIKLSIGSLWIVYN